MTNFQDVLRDVHDPDNHQLRTSASLSATTVFIGTPTLNAVVNTSAATDPKIFIGLTTTVIGGGATIFAVVNTSAAGQSSVVLDRGHNFVGLATVVQSSTTRTLVGNVTIDSIGSTVNTAVLGNVTIDSGTVSLTGNVTLSDAKTFVGLVSVSGFTTPLPVDATGQGDVPVTLAGETVVLAGGTNQIGSVTIPHVVSTTFSGNVTIDSGTITDITNPVALKGNLTLSDSKTFIGLVTVGNTVTVDATGQGDVPITLGGEAVVLGAGVAGVGFATVNVVNTARSITGNLTVDQVDVVTAVTDITNPVALKGNLTIDSGNISVLGNVTLSDSKTYIGLVTATSLNAGTTKTLIHKNIELSTSSVATIAVAAGGNAIFKITNVLLNSNATARVSIKSGATYLTGNASIGVTLNPGGGWVETGSVDSPVYYGLASGSAIVMEKFDMTATAANVAGKVIFYQE